VDEAPPPDVLRPLGRREPVIGEVEDFRPSRLERLVVPRPSAPRVALAILRWTSRALRLLSLLMLDRVLARGSEERTASHVLRLSRQVSPIGRKVLSQLAYRFDLLPVTSAMALARVDDRMPPLPVQTAVSLVEEGIGGPLHTVFRAFDPQHLGSRVLRCTYQAELLDGTPVIVRIRPPGARQQLVDEVTALGALLSALELLSIVRTGSFRYLRSEMISNLMEEADFRFHARAESLFRERIASDGLGFLWTPGVHREWLSDRMMVSDRADGTSLAALIPRVERRDPDTLAWLRAQGTSPRALARRLLHLRWWEQLEHLCFHADPLPADIIVTAGGKLGVVHFCETGVTSSRHRRLLTELNRRLDADDTSGAAECLVQFLAPLPFIDTAAFTKRVEGRLWHHVFALRDREAAWWERTSAGQWAALLTTTREEGVQVHADLIRLVRASVMFEAMAFRLDPTLDLHAQFRRYQRKADKRAARAWIDGVRDRLGDDPRPMLVARLNEATSLAQRLVFFAEVALESLPVSNLAMPRKAAYVASVALQVASIAVLVAALGVLATLIAAVSSGTPTDLSAATLAVVQHPLYLLLIVTQVAIGVRRVMFRLEDTDPGGS
jgi:ubiquinone biosynthesis protein